ncbi:MAG: hypothetical protein AAGI30_02575 [Planctomycetota bacterium]
MPTRRGLGAIVLACASGIIAQQPCPGDADGSGAIDGADAALFFTNIPDLDGFPGSDGFDVARAAQLLAQGCDPILLGLEPRDAAPGEPVCLTLANIPDAGNLTPDDVCAFVDNGVAFDGLELIQGLQNDIKLVLTPLPLPPDAGVDPGEVMIGFGDGNRGPIRNPPGGAIDPDVWVWQGNPNNPGLVLPGQDDFGPVADPPPPPPGKKFQTTWEFRDGALCFDLPDDGRWERCDEITVQFRAWCTGFRIIDVNIPRIVICKENPTAVDVARLICDAIVTAFANRGVTINCEIVCSNDVCTICLTYPDCDIDSPAWQFNQGPARPFAYVCIEGPAEDCDEICENGGPTVKDWIVNDDNQNGVPGEPGETVCVFIDPDDLPRGVTPGTIDPKDVCMLGSNGVVFDVKDIQVVDEPGTGEPCIKITACIFQVPPGAAGVPGRFQIMFGDGECNDIPDPDPQACPIDPIWKWEPLQGGGMVAGGDFVAFRGDPTDKKFVAKWTLENGRQCLVIPRDFKTERCDVVEILLRLWCPIRRPDINIPKIAICGELDCEQFASLICRAITDAFTSGPNPINEIDCRVEELADGSWKVSLGYTDCEVTGGVAETGLPWTQVAVCRNLVGCDEICGTKAPPIEIKDILALDDNMNNIPGEPGERICLFVCNFPPDKGPDQLCLSTTGGQLFQVLNVQPVDTEITKITAIVLPVGANVQGGQILLVCGQGLRVDPDLPPLPGPGAIDLVLDGPVPGLPWIWQPDPGAQPADDGGFGWEPRGGDGQEQAFCPGGLPTESWFFDPTGVGKLCLPMTTSLQPGEMVSIFLRAYCTVRSPDVTIPGIKNTGTVPIDPVTLAGIICDIITQAYIAAGIPQIECTVDTSGPFPVIKLGYTDCLVDGPTWSGGSNPSTFVICPCP